MNIPVEFKVFAPPFRWDRAGGIRIGRSRVTLDSLLAAYQNATAPIGQIIDDLYLFVCCSLPDEYEGQIIFIPFP